MMISNLISHSSTNGLDKVVCEEWDERFLLMKAHFFDWVENCGRRHPSRSQHKVCVILHY